MNGRSNFGPVKYRTMRIPLLLIFVLLLAACATPAAPASQEAVGDAATEAGGEPDGADSDQIERLRVAIVGDESTLTPYTYVTGYPGWNMLTMQYDTLYQIDLNGIPQPWLATGAEVSEDGLTVTVDLRDDVTWHDGEPFTAEDVKFSYEYHVDYPRGRFSRDLRPVESVEVESDTRVIIQLVAPAPSFEQGTLADVPIMPQHIWSEITSPEEQPFEGGNIGTGPYQLVEYVPDQFYRFEAYNDYFAGTPVAQELVAIQFADDTGTLAALRGGEVDMIVTEVPPEQIDLLSAMPDLAVIQGPLFSTDMLNYDMERAPFNSSAVRQAMSLAIDRQDLIDTVYLGTATAGNVGWIHPGSPVFNADVETLTDVAQATQILDDAGIIDNDGDGVRELDGEPLSFEFLVESSDSIRLRLAELVAEMLKEIGMEVNVSAVEQATWEDAVWPGFDVSQGRNYDMAMWGWSAPVQADPVRISSLVHSDPAIGSLNLTGYQSEEADALAEAITTEVDAEARAELIGQLQAVIAQDLPFIMLLYPDGAYAFNSGVYDGWAFMTGQGVFHKLSLLPESAHP